MPREVLDVFVSVIDDICELLPIDDLFVHIHGNFVIEVG